MECRIGRGGSTKHSEAPLGHCPFPEAFLTTVSSQALAGSPSRKGRGLNQQVTPASLSTRLSLEGMRASQLPPHCWSAATGSHPSCSFCQDCPSHYPLSTHQTPVPLSKPALVLSSQILPSVSPHTRDPISPDQTTLDMTCKRAIKKMLVSPNSDILS